MARMGRKRTKDRDLPQRVYQRHGAFYFVARDGTWTRLGATKSEALRAYAELLDGSSVSFSAVAEKYRLLILPRKAFSTQKDQAHQLDRLIRAFGKMPIRDIRRGHIARYRDERTAPIAANRELALISHVFARAMEWELCSENPCVGVERLTEEARERYVTDEEFIAVFDAANGPVRAMMALALITGQREGDLLKMRVSDMTEQGLAVQQGKTKKRLMIQWSDALRWTCQQALELPRRAGIVSTFLVCQPSGQPYSSDGFGSAWQRHMRKCVEGKLIAERFTFHDLRAKAASDGKDDKLLGHRDPRVLDRHYRRLPETVRPTR